jgi:hypothetical protein
MKRVKTFAAAVFAKDWSARGHVQIALLLLIVVGLVASAVASN